MNQHSDIEALAVQLGISHQKADAVWRAVCGGHGAVAGKLLETFMGISLKDSAFYKFPLNRFGGLDLSSPAKIQATLDSIEAYLENKLVALYNTILLPKPTTERKEETMGIYAGPEPGSLELKVTKVIRPTDCYDRGVFILTRDDGSSWQVTSKLPLSAGDMVLAGFVVSSTGEVIVGDVRQRLGSSPTEPKTTSQRTPAWRFWLASQATTAILVCSGLGQVDADWRLAALAGLLLLLVKAPVPRKSQ